MSQSLALSQPNCQAPSLPRLPQTLAQAIETEREFYEPPAQFKGFLGDGSEHWVQPDGYWREAPWKPPAKLTDIDRTEARRALEAMAPALEQASFDAIASWVADLGAIKKKTAQVAQDFEAAVFTLSDQLQHDGYPFACFTPETVSEVAREIDWFGDYGDIAKALDVVRRRVEREAARLNIIAEGSAGKSKPQEAQSEPCTGKKYTAMLREMYAANGMDYPGDDKATLTDICKKVWK